MQRSLLKITSAAVGLIATSTFAFASAPKTQANVTSSSSMQAAPDPTVHLRPPESHSCGIFETCANTKIGLGKGDFLIRLSALGLITNNTHSSVNIRKAPDALAAIRGRQGHISATNQVAPEFTFEYFLTDHISLDVIAASPRHEARAHGTKVPNPISTGPNHNLDVGSFWVLPPTLTAAWHFRPHKRFNPYVGIGITVAFFHNTSPAQNNGVKAVFDKLKLEPTVGPSFNLGFDYQVVGNWFFNFDIKQILLLDTPVHLNSHSNPIRVHAHDSINPTVIAGGIEYRF
ncbi:outer membrane beta-barrel protein [Saccharibacter sp. 17.LH.SD]|uniref:OmpW/AlkL family protein n=1 Tax=Saccharibacter sp. 17.LH.SD TaxID=2689393 RepID=UPI0013708833|nr:OmpW family outer membrane protein [Saccharibacter sp. 17.LH.SD]MXV45202.1 outer membrane beta-barrel protein [Saccharibacter sp. 17.LH.SD]